jgi:hypothetical protein
VSQGARYVRDRVAGSPRLALVNAAQARALLLELFANQIDLMLKARFRIRLAQADQFERLL